MTREQFATLRQRFGFACAYCGTKETGAGAASAIDHFQPTSRGGLDDESNWVYCYPACNTFKAAFWNTAPDDGLLNPLHDDVLRHLKERNGTLIGLTARAERHIERLHLNREQLVAQRQDNAERANLLERLHLIEADLQRALELQEEADIDE